MTGFGGMSACVKISLLNVDAFDVLQNIGTRKVLHAHAQGRDVSKKISAVSKVDKTI